jgi:hypothetical protein
VMARTRKLAPGVRFIPGVCFGCSCTDEDGCEVGCEWTDPDHTMCSACEERARLWLAWFKVVGRKAVR